MSGSWHRLARWATAMAAGALLAAPVLAQTRGTVARPDFSGYAKGAQVASGGETYIFLPEVRAMPGLRRGESGAQALNRMNLAGRPVVEQKGRFVLYREQGGIGVTALSAPAPGGAPLPVLLNARTGGLAVVQGMINVRLQDPADADAVGEALQLPLTSRFDHLKLPSTAPPRAVTCWPRSRPCARMRGWRPPTWNCWST